MSRVITCGQCGAQFDLEMTNYQVYMLNNHHSIAWLRNTIYLCHVCYDPIAGILRSLNVTATPAN